MTPWLELCRAAVGDLREVFASMPTRNEREPVVGDGVGGDQTTAVDAAAEAAIVTRLAALHDEEGVDFHLVSEELGERDFGPSPELTVVVDPIDGSLNAKRLIPSFCVSIAVSAGDTMEDVRFAFVHDLGTGEEFTATLHGGAQLNGEPLAPEPADEGAKLEVVGLEAARPDWIVPVAQQLNESVYRIRVVGSVALTLCYVGGARFDGMATANTCRSVDAAAAQLVAREAGAFVSVLGYGGVEAPLDLDARYRIVAARTPEGLDTLARALTDSRD